MDIWQNDSNPVLFNWREGDTEIARVGIQPEEWSEKGWTLLPYTSADEFEAAFAPKPKENEFSKAKFEALIAAGFTKEDALTVSGLV